MKFQIEVLIISYIILVGSSITFGYPMKSFSLKINPFGDCEVFQIGATKRATESREFLDEAQLAFFPIIDVEDAFGIEIHVKETIFRLTLTRTTITLDKCNYITKRCTVEQETRTELNDYIIPHTWNTVSLQVHIYQMSIHIGPRIVYNMTFSDYPVERISWLVKNRQVMDHKTKKEIAMFGDQIKYLVQFMCEEYEANVFTSPSTTELISFTNYITESIQSIDYDEFYDYNDVITITIDADELKDTTLVTKPSLSTSALFYPKFTNKEFHQTSTLDPGFFADYDLYDTKSDSTTELSTSNYFSQTEVTEHSEKHQILLLTSATTEPIKHSENERVSTIVDSIPETTLMSYTVAKTEVEDYEDYSAISPFDSLLTTSTSITAGTWTVSPELPMKTFGSLYVVLIAGLVAGIFIVLTVIIYCIIRKRRSVPISENVLPEEQKLDK